MQISEANSKECRRCKLNTYMRLSEIQPTKPKNPDQQKVANLKATANRANAALKAERARQQQRKSQQALAAAQQQIKQAAA